MATAEETPRRGPGRPPKAPGKGTRRNYAFRMSDETRNLVVAAADEAGRSMSEEIEWRVEESFREKQSELLAKSLLNGSDNLYKLISRISGLVSSLENYKDKSGNRLGSMDWDNHEPTRAAIRAGISALINDLVPPVTDFDIDNINKKQKEIFSRIDNNGKLSEDDTSKLEEYYNLVSIHHMELIGKVLAGILGGSVSLQGLQSAVSPPN